MTQFFGIYHKQCASIPKEWIDSMQQASSKWPCDRSNSLSLQKACFACQQHFATPESPYAIQPFQLDHHPYILLFSGRLDNRQTLAQQLNITIDNRLSDETLVLLGYHHWREELPQHLKGDYTFVVYHPDKHTLFIVRDNHGILPLYIAENAEYLAFASNIPALLTLPWVNKKQNSQWVADYLTATRLSQTDTVYQGIKSLAPAHQRLISTNHTCSQRYWQLDLTKKTYFSNDQDYILAFREKLEQSVKRRVRGYGQVGSELSGGLDSTSICAVAASQLKAATQQLYAFSHVLPNELVGKVFPYHDEKPWIQQVLDQHENIEHLAYDGQDTPLLTAMQHSLSIHGAPPCDDLTPFAYGALKWLKSHDCRVLLSGFGGDQLVTNQCSGWQTQIYHRHKRWRDRFHACRHYTLSTRHNWRALASMLKSQYYSSINNKKAWQRVQKASSLYHTFIRSQGYPQRYLLSLHRRQLQDVQQRQKALIESAIISQRTASHTLGAQRFGVHYRFPLLDTDLLEFCLSIPLEQTINAKMHRRLMRLATADILPSRVRLRTDKSRATVPITFQRLLTEKRALLQLIEQAEYPGNNRRIYRALKQLSDTANRQRPNANLLMRQINFSLWLLA